VLPILSKSSATVIRPAMKPSRRAFPGFGSLLNEPGQMGPGAYCSCGVRNIDGMRRFQYVADV
jgi:hypothetical protein